MANKELITLLDRALVHLYAARLQLTEAAGNAQDIIDGITDIEQSIMAKRIHAGGHPRTLPVSVVS